MIQEVSAVKFRQNLGEMLARVRYRNDSFVILKDGEPVAALVDANLFARIRRMREQFDELTREVAEAFSGIPEDVGNSMIERAIAEERGKL